LIVLAPTRTESASLPGANGRIAFHSNRDGDNEIYSIKADGTGTAQLTDNSADDVQPAWSPNGKSIAFASNRDGSYQVFVMDADGSNAQALTNDSVGAGHPTWAPDGKSIAYNGMAEGNWDIYVISVATQSALRATTNPANDTEPRWSPDGRHIAFVSSRDGNPELYVMGASGMNSSRLTNTPAEEKEISWSPDSEKIAFASPREGAKFQVFVMDPDGSNPVKITDDPVGAGAPAWSPDGARMAFHSVRDGQHDIWVMNPDGTGQEEVTPVGDFGFGPDWQPLGGLRGDINCDGGVGAVDSLLILRQVAALAVNLPQGCPDLQLATPAVSSGLATLFGLQQFDFEMGTSVYETGDVLWRQITAVERELVPSNDALITNLGAVDYDAITLDELMAYSYGSAPINGNDDPSNQLVVGDVFAVKTADGNYAKAKVATYGYDLELQWTTYPDRPRADMNCNGAVDAIDSLFILRHVALLPVNLPQGCFGIGS
jgi:Tol biopolymer transport system component